MTQLSRGDEAVVVAVEDLVLLLGASPIPVAVRESMGRSNLEGLADFLLGVGVLHLPCHHGQELWLGASVRGSRLRQRGNTRSPPPNRRMSRHTREVNGAVVVGVDLVNHILQLRLGRVLSQGPHDRAELLGGDLSCTPYLSMILAIDVIIAWLEIRHAQAVAADQA